MQNFVALSEIPIVTEQKHVNRKRLFTSGELVLDIMHKKSVAYALCLDLKINVRIAQDVHVSLKLHISQCRKCCVRNCLTTRRKVAMHDH